MAIEKSFPNTNNLTDTLKSIQFKEAGAPGKIETGVKKPACSYLADLKELVNSLGFTYVNDNFGSDILAYCDNLLYKKGDWQLILYPNPILTEILPNGPKYVRPPAHKAYIQWQLSGGGTEIIGLTPGQLFFAIKG